MVRYYGSYDNAHRGKMRKTGQDPLHPPSIEDEASFIPSRGWAEMIRKVYETNPLACPKCGGTMRIVSFIEEHKVIDKIIKHLKLTFKAERPPPGKLSLVWQIRHWKPGPPRLPNSDTTLCLEQGDIKKILGLS